MNRYEMRFPSGLRTTWRLGAIVALAVFAAPAIRAVEPQKPVRADGRPRRARRRRRAVAGHRRLSVWTRSQRALSDRAVGRFGHRRYVEADALRETGRDALRRRLARLKKFVCQQLSLVGSAAEVPILAKQFRDDELAFPAIFALERIPGDEPLAAMRDALGAPRA